MQEGLDRYLLINALPKYNFISHEGHSTVMYLNVDQRTLVEVYVYYFSMVPMGCLKTRICVLMCYTQRLNRDKKCDLVKAVFQRIRQIEHGQ